MGWNKRKNPPEETGTYIVYAPKYRGRSSRPKEKHDGMMFAQYSVKQGRWLIERNENEQFVEFWRPLPKKPKGV